MDVTPDEERDLRASLVGLSALLTSSQSLETTLEQVAALAARAVPGADGVGIALLLRDGGTGTRVASTDLVGEVDRIQYHVGEGPCLAAVTQQRVQRSGSLGGDARWPRSGPRIGRLGVHSALSVPLLIPGEVLGALNVYACGKDAFDETSERLGVLFAAPAAVSVHHAQVLVESQRLTTQLNEALSTRATIDRAIGIIMSQSGSTAEEAFDRLRTISQREQAKLAQVAARLVDDAVRRARARSRPATS